MDKRKLLELEEQKRQAEEDKLAAINALEQRSKELLRVNYHCQNFSEISNLIGQR